jgi:hypothetical protein
MQLVRAINECRTEYNILIDEIMNSQKGILQPHIITAAEIVNIPIELSLSIPLSATYQNLIVNIDFDVFIKDQYLVYVTH